MILKGLWGVGKGPSESESVLKRQAGHAPACRTGQVEP